MAKRYYNGERIEKTTADYKMLLGGRNIGKSYDVKKERVLKRCIEHDRQFVYLRRWDRDIRNQNVENYFADLNIGEISNGDFEGLYVWQNKIYLVNYDEKGKIVYKWLIGWAHSLATHERYKSQMFPLVEQIIFEEFITDENYLTDEPDKLQDYVSTIFRERRGTVWLIGNTISHLCPYFSAWKLDKVLQMKTHEINIFENITPVMTEDGEEDIVVRVAVEMCGAENVFSKMAFGSSASMIIKNEWKNKFFPKIDEMILLDSEELYTIFIVYDNLKFKAQFKRYKDNYYWYVMPFTKKLEHPETTRIIQREPSPYYLHTTNFYALSNREAQAFQLLKQRKIFYCSDSCGTDFTQVLKSIGY